MDNHTDTSAPSWNSSHALATEPKPPTPGLQSIDHWYDCGKSKLGWRWNTTLPTFAGFPSGGQIGNIAAGKHPISGIMELELGMDKKIKVAYAEFNTATWYKNIGKCPNYLGVSD